MSAQDPRRERALLVAALLIAVAVGASSAWHWTATFDEPNHLEMGRRIVEQRDWGRFDNSKMPVSALNALPWVLLQESDPSRRLWAARLPQLGWLVGTALVVRAWAARRYGRGAGAISAGAAAACLVAWDPNLLAHASLVTTDAPCVFFVTLCCFLLVRAMEDRAGARGYALAGAAFGLAQAAKFTAAFLLPIELLIAAGWCAARRTLRPLLHVPTFALAAWIALNGAYAFQGTFTPADQIQWRSQTFAPLQAQPLPLPFPRPWLEGLDWVKSDDDQGHGNIYLDGEMTPDGQRDYFVRALAWKLPLPLLILPAAGGLMTLLGAMRRAPTPGTFSRASDLGWAVPLGFFGLYFSLAFNFQLGVRYVLPIVPLLALAAARLPPKAVAGAALWSLLSGLSWWPWGLSYFNERLTDRASAWRHLADSNLDWGQTGHLREAWRSEHPEGLVDPEVPAPGPQLISANALTGVLGDPARLACYREHLPPDAHAGYALYPMDLTAEDLSACFPWIRAEGRPDGAIPAGRRLVVLRFRGRASLQIEGWRAEAEGGGEVLIGVLVDAALPFDLTIDHEGPEMLIFVDGAPLEAP